MRDVSPGCIGWRQGRLIFSQLVKLVQLGFEQLLVGKPGLVFGDHSGRHGAAQGVFNDLMVLRGAQQHANRRLFVRLLDVAVEGFEVELQLAQILRLKFVNFQFKRHQTCEASMEKQQVEFEVSPADLDRVMTADKAEIATEFDKEILEPFNQAAMKVGFRVIFGQVEKFDEVTVSEDGYGIGMQNCQRC